MRKYWIMSMSEDNYRVCHKKNLIGMESGKEKTIKRFQKGDYLTFYITRKKVDSLPSDVNQKVQEFRGRGEITGDPYLDDSHIFYSGSNEIYPWRVSVKFHRTGGSVKAKSIIDNLHFYSNALYWALPLRRGYTEISKQDWDFIQSRI